MSRADGIDMSSGVIISSQLRNLSGDVVMGRYVQRGGVSFNIAQKVEDSNIRITEANVTSFTAGSMINSSLHVGVLGRPDDNGDGVTDLPSLADMRSDFKIGRVRIKGYRGAVGDLFANSNLAADSIGMVQLKNATLDNDGETFGIATNNARLRVSLTQTTPRGRFSFRNGAWTTDPGGDLEVRLV